MVPVKCRASSFGAEVMRLCACATRHTNNTYNTLPAAELPASGGRVMQDPQLEPIEHVGENTETSSNRKLGRYYYTTHCLLQD